MSDTPQSRQQQFAQLSEENQEAALAFIRLAESDDPVSRAAKELLAEDHLSKQTIGYLMDLLAPSIRTMFQTAQDDLHQLDRARSAARSEAERLNYNWKARRSSRKHKDPHRDDLDYYTEFLANESRPTPNISAYVALLRKRFRVEN